MRVGRSPPETPQASTNVVKSIKAKDIITSGRSRPRYRLDHASSRTALVLCSAVVEGSSSDSTGEERARRRGVRDTCMIRCCRASSCPSGRASASQRCPYEGFRLRFQAAVARGASVAPARLGGHTWRGGKSWMADGGCRHTMTVMGRLRKETIEGLVAAVDRLACVGVGARECRRNHWFAG